MTWSDFQNLGFRLTEKEIAGYDKKVEQAYNDAWKTINKKLKAQYLKLSEVAPENYYNEMLKYNRLNELLKQVQTDYLKYSTQAGKDTLTGLRVAMSNNYYRQQFALQWGAVDAKYTLLPEKLIEATVFGTEQSIKNITDAIADRFGNPTDYVPQVGSLTALIKDNATKEVSAITRAITNGLINGNGYRQTAAAVRNVIGRATPEGYTGAMASAKRIVQTESTRVLNAAAYANSQQAESQGVKVIREWQATLDTRTRDRHAQLDGDKADKNGYFYIAGDRAKYPGEFSEAGMNINCRCSVIEYTEGMRPDIRTGRNPITGENETFSYKQYPEWAEAQGLKQSKSGEWK